MTRAWVKLVRSLWSRRGHSWCTGWSCKYAPLQPPLIWSCRSRPWSRSPPKLQRESLGLSATPAKFCVQLLRRTELDLTSSISNLSGFNRSMFGPTHLSGTNLGVPLCPWDPVTSWDWAGYHPHIGNITALAYTGMVSEAKTNPSSDWSKMILLLRKYID